MRLTPSSMSRASADSALVSSTQQPGCAGGIVGGGGPSGGDFGSGESAEGGAEGGDSGCTLGGVTGRLREQRH